MNSTLTQQSDAGEHASIDTSKSQKWLEVIVARLHAEGAILLLQETEKPIVVGRYPNTYQLDHRLYTCALRAFKERSVIKKDNDNVSSSDKKKATWLAIRFTISGIAASIAIKITVQSNIPDKEILKKFRSSLFENKKTSNQKVKNRRTKETVSKKSSMVKPAKTNPAKPDVIHEQSTSAKLPSKSELEFELLIKEQGAVIKTLAKILDQQNFSQSLHEFANCIAKCWQCSRVTIALSKNDKLTIQSISGVAEFDVRSALLVDIKSALQETYSHQAMILYPPSDDNEIPQFAHAALAKQVNHQALCSLPLIDNDQVIGSMLLERDKQINPQEKSQLQRMVLLMSPIIALKQLKQMNPWQWFKLMGGKVLSSLFGSNKLGTKLVLSCIVGLFVFCATFTTMFRVDAEAAIEATKQRAVVAYVPSFLTQVERKAGDVVKQGDVLARLDVEELQLEKIKWVGERDKIIKEYRANLAQRDRSNVRILDAKRTQAQSQIDLLNAQIERATLRAPIDGVVIAGDLSQSLGSPVERGQLLFEIASLENYRLTLLVDEADIGWIKIGQLGHLRLRSSPDQSLAFSVNEITPVSEAQGGANQFRVVASMQDAPISIRPGMAGFAKIEVEERAIGWIWIRSFLNWLRLTTWKYIG